MPVWDSLPIPGGQTAKVSGPEGTALSPVHFSAPPAEPAPPAAATFPFGVLYFRLVGVAPGGTATVEVELPAPVNAYYKLSPDGSAWNDFAWDGTTGARFGPGNLVRLTLQDGGRGDGDGAVNGVIEDPGAPALVLLEADTVAPTIACGTADGAWHGDNVSIECTAHDDGSGLADPADSAFTLSTSVPDGSEDANASTDSRQVCDGAGNCAAAGPVEGNKIDRKAPALFVPADKTVDSTSPGGATVGYSATAPTAPTRARS